MTALDRQLAKTFRAARWAESNGEAVCPDCFDGDALLVDKEPRLAHPGLKSYRCRDCQNRFSDLSGTPLRGTSAPLRDWALALLTLGGHPTRSVGSGKTVRFAPVDLGPPLKRLAAMREKWQASLGLRTQWLQVLQANRLTVERLAYGRSAA